MKKVYIIVLNYNNWKDTIECVKSLLNLDYKNYQIIIVDNNSSDNSIKKIEEFLQDKNATVISEESLKKSLSKIVFIKAKKNRGYSAGNNIGIRFAKINGYDFIWILNNDTEVKKDSLKKFIKCAINSEKNVGLWGNPIYYYGTNFLQGIGGKFNKFIAQGGTVGYKEKDLKKACRKINKVDYPIGASMLLSKNFIEEVGMLNETYFLFFEEMDLVIRAKNMGWKFKICCDSIIYHKENVTVKKIGDFADFVRIKNRLIFTKRYFPCYLPFVYSSLIFAIFNRIRRGQLRNILKLIKDNK